MIRVHKDDPLDKRHYELVYHAGALNLEDISVFLTQRELRMIMKHIDKRNSHLTTILKDFIHKVDTKEGVNTNWNSYVPKTHIIRVF